MNLDGGGAVGSNSEDREMLKKRAGSWTDITLDQLGRPTIVYRSLQKSENEQVLTSSVRFIAAQEAKPNSNRALGTPQELHVLTPPEEMMSLGYL